MAGPAPGRIFAVVGPSGAGKDTLMAEARRLRPDLIWARRVVTRPAGPDGEPHEGVDRAEFARRRAAGAFALWWEAHGLLYGVPASVRGEVAAGRTVMFNGSRAAIPLARRVFPALQVVMVTAPDEVLARRLAARGREAEGDIRARLARAVHPAPAGARIVMNDASVEVGVARLLAALSPSAGSGG